MATRKNIGAFFVESDPTTLRQLYNEKLPISGIMPNSIVTMDKANVRDTIPELSGEDGIISIAKVSIENSH